MPLDFCNKLSKVLEIPRMAQIPVASPLVTNRQDVLSEQNEMEQHHGNFQYRRLCASSGGT